MEVSRGRQRIGLREQMSGLLQVEGKGVDRLIQQTTNLLMENEHGGSNAG